MTKDQVLIDLPEILKTEKDVLDRIRKVNKNLLSFKETNFTIIDIINF